MASRGWRRGAFAVVAAAAMLASAAHAQPADLQITKSAPAEVMPSANFAWTLQITNAGPGAADGATFSDPLPQGVINVSAQCAASGGAACGAVSVTSAPLNYIVSGAVAKLPAGGSVTIVIDVTAPSLIVSPVPVFPPMVNVATVAPPAGVVDPVPGNDQAQTTTSVKQADLVVAKSHAGTFHQGQQGATYTLVVTNIGVLRHDSFVFVDDALPPGLALKAASGSGWTCAIDPSLNCISTTSIPPGASLPPITVTVDVAANAPPTLVNVAHVAGVQNSVTTNDTATDLAAVVQVGPIPTLSPTGAAMLGFLLAAVGVLALRRSRR